MQLICKLSQKYNIMLISFNLTDVYFHKYRTQNYHQKLEFQLVQNKKCLVQPELRNLFPGLHKTFLNPNKLGLPKKSYHISVAVCLFFFSVTATSIERPIKTSFARSRRSSLRQTIHWWSYSKSYQNTWFSEQY